MSEIINIENLNLTEEKIESISLTEDIALDMEVENFHHYILDNGIISHNTSTLANVVSSGLEPIFLQEYIRTAIVPYPPEGLVMPIGIDFDNKACKEMHGWEWTKEGDENILRTEFNGYVYKIDSNRGLTKEHLVIDYGVNKAKELGFYDPDAEWCVDTYKLGIHEHVDTMKVMSRYIDSAMSKCVSSKDSMVIIDGKIKYLDELEHHNEEDSFKEFSGKIKNHENEIVNIKSVYNNGYQDVIKIKLSNGSSIKCTYNHMIYTKNGWTKAIDLKVGTLIDK